MFSRNIKVMTSKSLASLYVRLYSSFTHLFKYLRIPQVLLGRLVRSLTTSASNKQATCEEFGWTPRSAYLAELARTSKMGSVGDYGRDLKKSG